MLGYECPDPVLLAVHRKHCLVYVYNVTLRYTLFDFLL